MRHSPMKQKPVAFGDVCEKVPVETELPVGPYLIICIGTLLCNYNYTELLHCHIINNE